MVPSRSFSDPCIKVTEAAFFSTHGENIKSSPRCEANENEISSGSGPASYHSLRVEAGFLTCHLASGSEKGLNASDLLKVKAES